MGKFLVLILVVVSVYFVAVTEGKKYMDLSCHPGYIGEARALEIEKNCRETDSSETECFKMCVLKGLGFVYLDDNRLSLESYATRLNNFHKLFSPEVQDVGKDLTHKVSGFCGDYVMTCRAVHRQMITTTSTPVWTEQWVAERPEMLF